MKSLFLFCILLFAPYFLAAQSFTIAVTPNVQTVSVGQTATYSIIITPLNGFNQTVFLTASTLRAGSISISSPSPNPPYSPSTLRIIPGIQDTGTLTITIRGKNIGVEATATCVLNVTKNPQWTTMEIPEISANHLTRKLTTDNLGDVCLLSTDADTFAFNYYRNQKWDSREVYSAVGFKMSLGEPFPCAFDKNGYLWVATQKGLLRYDGSYMSLFNNSNTAMASQSISSVDIDNNGNPVCIGRDPLSNFWNLERFDGTTWKSRVLNAYEVSYTAGFCVDSSNQVWIPAGRKGVFKVKNDIVTGYNLVGNDTDTNWKIRLSKVLCDKDGRVWCMFQQIGSQRLALSYFDGLAWHNILSPDIGWEYTSTFFLDADKNVWLTTQDALHRYNGTTWTTFNSTNSPLPTGTSNMVQDKNGNIWMLIDNLFYIYNPNGLVGIPLAPTAVEEQPTEATGSIRISPNPAASSVNISGLQGATSLRMVNYLGETVIEIPREQIGNSDHEINVSGLASGLYVIQIRTATGVFSKQIVVHH